MKTWAGCAVMALTILAGAIIWSLVRMAIYNITGEQPNMAPGMFVLFAPILALPLILITLLIHYVFAKRFGYESKWQWIAAGISYSTVFLGLINLWLLIIPFGANPLTIKMYRKMGATSS